MENNIEIRKASLYSIPILINIRAIARIKQYIKQYPDLTEKDFIKSPKEIKKNIVAIRKLMKYDNELWLTAKSKNRIVGFIRAKKDSENIGHISALFVYPNSQGLGVGTLLLQRALQWLKDTYIVRLVVVEKNVEAIKFYKRNGFKVDQIKVKPFTINNRKNINRIAMLRKT